MGDGVKSSRPLGIIRGEIGDSLFRIERVIMVPLALPHIAELARCQGIENLGIETDVRNLFRSTFFGVQRRRWDMNSIAEIYQGLYR